ncbi:glycosyltransferase [Peribacillus asahii]|nr:glycosyltransferase [Peribacillus asahii]
MVFDVPAESGGALSILHEFYNKFKEDEENEYIFVVSKPKLDDTQNIKVLSFPWIKKSWLHRLYFDNFVASKLISKYEVDRVLSLQNMIIPHTNAYQTVYVHNSLPFVEHRFSIGESRLLWIHQNILSKGIFQSIKEANKVIVQTEWMKKKCIDMLNVDSNKIEVISPQIDIDVKKRFVETRQSLSTFFYPASGALFKNHKVIIDACIKLKEQRIGDYKVVFTLSGDENEHISALYKKVKEKEIPVHFIGGISREEVFEYYSNSILVFPSFIETVGLPLIEAKMHGTPILASDCAFSHEILDGYDNVQFFNAFNSVELTRKFSEAIKG